MSDTEARRGGSDSDDHVVHDDVALEVGKGADSRRRERKESKTDKHRKQKKNVCVTGCYLVIRRTELFFFHLISFCRPPSLTFAE